MTMTAVFWDQSPPAVAFLLLQSSFLAGYFYCPQLTVQNDIVL